MDKLLFLHIEIKHVLNVLHYITPEEKIQLMAAIGNLPYDELVKILKTLYKVEKDYFEYLHSDAQRADELIKSLQP